LPKASEDVEGTNGAIEETSERLMHLGLKQKDASHVACAIEAEADYFITVDKGILKRNIKDITVLNPIQFLEDYSND
jgi:predicted nucleic acid-binding protein